MERVLIGSDGSAGAQAALRLGGKFAKAMGWAVTLVHAATVHDAVSMGVIPVPSELEEYSADVGHYVLKQGGEILDELDVEHEEHQAFGFPALTLLDLIAKDEPRLVVTGTRGVTGMERRVFGSVADRLAHWAPCPVLLVPPEKDDTVAGIMLAVDGSEASNAALLIAGWTARALDVPVRVVNVRDAARGLVKDPVGTVLNRDGSDVLDAAVAALEAAGVADVRPEQHEGDAARVIADLADENDVDVLIVGRRGRNLTRALMGSVSDRVMQSVDCATLVVPASAASMADNPPTLPAKD